MVERVMDYKLAVKDVEKYVVVKCGSKYYILCDSVTDLSNCEINTNDVGIGDFVILDITDNDAQLGDPKGIISYLRKKIEFALDDIIVKDNWVRLRGQEIVYEYSNGCVCTIFTTNHFKDEELPKLKCNITNNVTLNVIGKTMPDFNLIQIESKLSTALTFIDCDFSPKGVLLFMNSNGIFINGEFHNNNSFRNISAWLDRFYLKSANIASLNSRISYFYKESNSGKNKYNLKLDNAWLCISRRLNISGNKKLLSRGIDIVVP